MKLGAIFDSRGDPSGKPDAGEKTYTGTFGEAETCVQKVLAEAKARGSDEAEEIVLLSDGGGWLWNRLPGAFAGKKVKEILGQIDINTISPVEALLKLNEIKVMLKNKPGE